MITRPAASLVLADLTLSPASQLPQGSREFASCVYTKRPVGAGLPAI